MPSYEGGSFSLGYIDPTDRDAKDCKQMMDEFYQAQYVGNSSLWLQGAIDMRFKVGDQHLYNLVYGNSSSQYQKFFLNMIQRHISMCSGFQRKNRKSTIVLPITDKDDPLADDYNAAMRWSEDRDGYQEYHSQAFEGAISTGMNMLWMYLDYVNDPYNGDIFTDNVAYNNFLIDQYYRKQDLSDCNGIWRRRWTSKQGAKLLIPGYADEIDKMKSAQMKDGRFPLQAELQNVAINNLFTFDEFHYRSTRTAKMILDPYTQEAMEWEEGEESEEEMKKIMQMQPWLQVKKMQVPTCKMVISLGNHVVYHGPNQLGVDNYPCVPALCYHEPDIQAYAWRVRGIVRNLRDPQFLYNMRKVIELNILQTQINSGWIFPTDAVVDVKAFRQTGEGFLIPLKAGHLPNEIQRIEPSAIPQSLLELSASLSEDITKISGINEELLGSATDDKSGILSMLRQGASLVTLQTIFDKMDYTQRLYGKLRLQTIRKNFSKSKITQILGHEPDPRFFTAHSLKYSMAVEEGNYATSQRQTELQQLLHFQELGMPGLHKAILRKAFISDKKQIMQDMQEDQQQQQQQQQAEMQRQEKENNAKIMSSFAKSKLDMARSAESYAKIEDIKASAERKESESDLTLLKMMLELEEMDLRHFRTTLDMAEEIKVTNGMTSKHPNYALPIEQTTAQGAGV